MNEKILRALMQLFALVIDMDKTESDAGHKRNIVERFLSDVLNKDQIEEYLFLFDNYLKQYSGDANKSTAKKKRKRGMLSAMKVMAICEEINGELQQKQKTYVLLKLLEFIASGEKDSEKELDFVLSVATAFNIDENEYLNCKGFVFDKLESIPDTQQILVAEAVNKKDSPFLIKTVNNLSGRLVFLHIQSTNTLAFTYRGNQSIYLNGQAISADQVYTFQTGSSLRSANIDTLYYTDIIKVFMQIPEETNTSLVVHDLKFRFKNSENGVLVNQLVVNSGQLVGVMGGSGAGKSTLLDILNGNIQPNTGEVLINGHDLYAAENVELFKGVIGHVTQDDILFEELTVFQNLYFNAQLCLSDYSDEKCMEVVEQMLYDLDLFEIKDLVVGNVLNKFISGGQRKRLNIALELIREPSILFADEPTSGLSSLDSEIVMNLLKELTLKGKIVIANIHQPSSDIFKMFDKILFLDKGGYLIYEGNPIDAITYFKVQSKALNAGKEQCFECGNVNTEQLLQIIESRVVNEFGKLTRTRKVNPKEWFELFTNKQKGKGIPKVEQKALPKNLYSIPSKIKQFSLFLKRDFFSKLTNKQYLLISFLEAPILAILLGFFTKYMGGENGYKQVYVFEENVNLPIFLFMSVVVALFLGLSISAEEIIKDRKHLKRESFLGLNYGSYLNSKIVLLFAISAIQMLSFVLIGNFILEIKGMTFHYWLILFSTSCFANLLGLNLSSALNSVITIYILIPFVLVPELLFSGTMVRFDRLHPAIASQKYTPFIGDIMTSRWAYEALAVEQFKSNKYQKFFFDTEQQISEVSYTNSFVLPELRASISFCKSETKHKKADRRVEAQVRLLQTEFEKLEEMTGIKFSGLTQFNLDELSGETLDSASAYLETIKVELLKRKSDLNLTLNKQITEAKKYFKTDDAFYAAKSKYYNKSLADLVTGRDEMTKVTRINNRLVQLKDPIYKKPDSRLGRAQLYASVKRIGNYEMDAFWFNFWFIWLTIGVLYIALRTSLLKKAMPKF